ncbi:MAG: hypothetical protein PHS14_14140, partial [Elusimicrobia bacterium]|nr:hypothetical protein [Elusimicrobiota bacterium]
FAAVPAFAAVPPSISELMLRGAAATTRKWSAVGDMTMGDFHANIQGIPPTCDMTVGSEIRLHLKNVTGMSDQLVAMMRQQQDQAAGQAKTGMATTIGYKKKEKQVTAVGAAKQEAVGGGWIVYYEYTENCAKHPNHRNTILRGFTNKGKVFAQFELTLTAPADEARAMASEILAKLQKFTPPPAGK